ncbi:tetratricopeptide repeat protein [Thalassotalea mangrovi]|uniref:Tetratricopeptide repeat protein n=1 Tax=Thalassotalea mangrovi TaxID=2572245 RepID=A0A4U1B7G6_9GAMM|nr:tetratricopeptide repeat protein [Thalassotalea mangrovi]TKB45890.1 tetratricopeptide repeat protein [Thalassotalea mangrovi]
MVTHTQGSSEQGLQWLKHRLQKQLFGIRQLIAKYRNILLLGVAIVMIIFTSINPQKFIDLWFTDDQQGAILFKLQRYQSAAEHFKDSHWQAYSYYGAEQFDTAANLFSQFDTAEDILARGNAYAHDRRYLRARGVYQALLEQYPDYQPAQHNLSIVQKLIDEVNRVSKSQQQEDGDAPKELGDDPQTGEGAERKVAPQQLEQYSAQELLQDPGLADMWLRQVQKDPAKFLAVKFAVQLQHASDEDNGNKSNANSRQTDRE